MKRLIYTSALILLAIAAWQVQASFFLPEADTGVLLMDTFVSIRVIGKNAARLVAEAEAEMARLEAVFSVHVESSEVSRINRSYPEAVQISAEVMEVLLLAREVHNASEGAFDVTVGGLLRLWGFGTDNAAVPEKADLAQAMAGVGLSNVELNEAELTVRLLNPQTRLDLGGIAKGYIVDRAVDLLRDRGARHILVDAGGDVRVFGGRPGENRMAPARAARVGVRHPRSPSALVAIVSVMDGAVLTSGDYERFFVENGVRYSHIIDARTGYPAQGTASVTVVAETAVVADALATAVLVLGPEKGLALLEGWPEVEGMIVTESLEVYMSRGMKIMTEYLGGS